MIWILVGLVVALHGLFFWSLCVVTARADRHSEEMRRAAEIGVDVLDWDVDEFNEQVVHIAPLKQARN